MTTSNLSAAADYIGEGLDILPLTPLSKIPLKGTRGVKDASDTIDAWEQDNNYNIGMACGASGIVVVDFDFRNGAPPVDSLFDDDDLENVVIVDTPSGGVHLWFKQPDTIIGCPKSSITGIDIKGDGGYVVVPPSKVNGKHYAFRSDHELNEIPLSNLAVLPQHIIDILIPAKQEWGRTDSTPIPVEAEEIRARLACIPPLGTYDDWLEVLMAVHSAYPDDIGVALCEEWSPGKKGEIAKKFESFHKGERGIGTLVYLSNKHGYTPPVNQEVRAKLLRVKAWLDTPAAKEWARPLMRQSAATFITTLRILIDIAAERASHRVYAPCRELANRLAVSPMAVSRRLRKMNDLGLLATEDTGKGQTLDLSPLFLNHIVTDVYHNGDTVTMWTSTFAAQHTGDDAFAIYPYWYAVKRRGDVAPLMGSLGPTGLELWESLEQGGTVKEIAEASGFSVASVRNAIKKFAACGLLEVDEYDKEKAYVLVEKSEQVLDEVRPHMVTYHVGQLRIARNALATADLAALKLRQRKHMTPRDIMWWENLRDDKDRVATLILDQLAEQGFDGRMKVGKEKAARSRRKYDFLEEWRTWGRPLFDAYNDLGHAAQDDKVRLLTVANVGEADKELFHMAYLSMRDKVEMMLMMARKRVQYERGTTATLQEDIQPTAPHNILQPELELT